MKMTFTIDPGLLGRGGAVSGTIELPDDGPNVPITSYAICLAREITRQYNIGERSHD